MWPSLARRYGLLVASPPRAPLFLEGWTSLGHYSCPLPSCLMRSRGTTSIRSLLLYSRRTRVSGDWIRELDVGSGGADH